MVRRKRKVYYDNLSKSEVIEKILKNDETLNDIEQDLIKDLLDNKDKKLYYKKDTKLAIFSDSLTNFLGSWKFITISLISITTYMLLNIIMKNSFDPFPFIFLNLVLGCVSALQAPIIMMSQNRQEEKERIKNMNDFKVNLKSQIIIEDLHHKIDKLIDQQNELFKK